VSLAPSNPPEILAADLCGLVLDLAHWGLADPAKLALLDPPPRAAWAEASALLRELGAIDADGRITARGRRLRALPLPPRIARMVIDAADAGAAALGAEIAAVLTERGLGGNDADLVHRLDELRRDRSARARDARAVARRWAELASSAANSKQGAADSSPGVLLALAYPDRIAKSRGAGGAFLLANGRGASLDPASALSREPSLAVGEIAGTAAQARILLAAPLTVAEIEAHFADRIETRDELVFDDATASLRARRSRRLGAMTLGEQLRRVEPNDDTSRLLAEGIARLGIGRLPWTSSLRQWRDRVMFLRRAEAEEWPDLSDAALAATTGDWLEPILVGKTRLDDVRVDELEAAVHALLPWPLPRRLGEEAPTHFVAPSGSKVPIDYAAEGGPKVAIRVQELFGLDRHPTVAGGRVPLTIELLSPAHRPVQVTRDLPGFWRGSYAAVKAEMRGRYPRHPWPDNPLTAPATRRAKPRGT
jgi:ATP-dependent helicase HrpB